MKQTRPAVHILSTLEIVRTRQRLVVYLPKSASPLRLDKQGQGSHVSAWMMTCLSWSNGARRDHDTGSRIAGGLAAVGTTRSRGVPWGRQLVRTNEFRSPPEKKLLLDQQLSFFYWLGAVPREGVHSWPASFRRRRTPNRASTYASLQPRPVTRLSAHDVERRKEGSRNTPTAAALSSSSPSVSQTGALALDLAFCNARVA
ncbi:hypothetical protein F4818DRAFT_386714 [Hypoxylon cercidicola]|nr:hypothetical protein F4818DRAFT_386714 [Hypoxylon cercidicola]